MVGPCLTSMVTYSLSSFVALQVHGISLLHVTVVSLPLNDMRVGFSVSLSFSDGLVSEGQIRCL